jgi:hypothetical protein
MSFRLITVLALAVLAGCVLVSCKREWTKKEVVEWYASVEPHALGGLLYQGSDEKRHYFVVRSFDEWVFIQLSRSELTLEEEHPYSGASSSPFSYYAVSPADGFRKIVPAKQPIKPPQTTTGSSAPSRV